MCYASTESLGLSELIDTNIISVGVPERISRAVESTNFTTIVFTLQHIMASKFANQLPIRNVGRTCNGSGNVWNWESRSRFTGTLENAAPYKIRCDFFSFFLCREDVINTIYVETTKRNADDLRKRIKAFGLLTYKHSYKHFEYHNLHMNKQSLHKSWGYLLSVHDFSPSCLDMIHFSRCSPPPDFNTLRSDPRCARQKKVKKSKSCQI